MPFQFEELTSASGMHYLRVDASDQVDLADAESLDARLQQLNVRGGRVLSVVNKGTEYSPEARKFFPSLQGKFSDLAVVVTSPIVRAAINMMIRLNRDKGMHMRLFTSEQEAMQWLERDRS